MMDLKFHSGGGSLVNRGEKGRSHKGVAVPQAEPSALETSDIKVLNSRMLLLTKILKGRGLRTSGSTSESGEIPGYFMIPDDPNDQRKDQSFTCPMLSGTFAYRRIPLASSNAPGDIQEM
ncbi:hypothetical protein Tco_0494738 [Tanacetum coccineum]